MPALSPTMTEGNIGTWRVKEGDPFTAGDLLLEIETDKATMDVEAKDDGILVRIMQGDGAKSVQVGTRIAVIAEPDDDVASLELPPEDPKPAKPAEAKSGSDDSSPKADRPDAAAPGSQASAPAPAGGKAHKQTYPPYPSVALLVKQHGLDDAAVASITPTGPNGRLLKGDVLAHVGSIKPNAPAAVSDMFDKLAKLDLSNIKVAAKKKEPSEAAGAKKAAQREGAPIPPPRVVIEKTVSLEKIHALQNKVSEVLGVHVPLSRFVKNAAVIANDGLPAPKGPPSADALFDEIVGAVSGPAEAGRVRGSYDPVMALPEFPAIVPYYAKPEIDIIDELTSSSPAAPSDVATTEDQWAELDRRLERSLWEGQTFSLSVPPEERESALVFMDRFSHLLSEEPRSLVQASLEC